MSEDRAGRQPVLLRGERIYLRDLRVADVGERYLGWLRDPEVTRFLESRFQQHTLEGLRDYVERLVADPHHVFLAIVQVDGDRHVGNIKLGPINWDHRRGEVGIVIGEKDCWGLGYATEAILLLVDYGFNVLDLHKLTAGCYATNPASAKAFINAGFREEGRRPLNAFFEGRYVDDIILGVIRE